MQQTSFNMTVNKADFKSQIMNYFNVFEIQYINHGYQMRLLFQAVLKINSVVVNRI